MMASAFIDPSIVPLKISDSVAVAIDFFKEFSVRQLPVVQDNICIGILSLDEIEEELADIPVLDFINLSYSFASTYDHIYEVMRAISEQSVTLFPIIDENNNYLGCITLASLFKNYVNCAAFSQPGSIVVLEMDKKNYSLAEIARIVESENKVILSSLLSSNAESDRLEITLKLNSAQIQNLLSTFERFGYSIKATFDEEDVKDTLKNRYESLMTYLNV
ncbi:MAG: CBS domain-containing protein [Saprospiraceae bacterium]|nr:CBS domain-containing protein [Saprospiraceae bacterium]MDP4700735.1 CBS domain-containing protein [Saprospiraceae bacterium]MDP4812117.1 CBS domain-containing protein [Saprospiraceae bacterium]MDP4815536.1 CBS domain-containing protein [Saprospiraceae bacterium]MDP4915140.1 CBS domain-containing protein [Saprospiraceae bacterium]